RIPYIVEYPGGDGLLRGALGGKPPFYPELYARAQEFALRQATIVVVDSTAIRDELVARGIDAARIVTAPPGADVAAAIETALAAGRRARRASRPATPTKIKCRTSGTRIPSGRSMPANRSRIRSSGSAKSSGTGT